MKHQLLLLILLCGYLQGYSQKVAISVNALPAIDKAFSGSISYALDNKNTVDLTGYLRPWKRSENYVNRYWIIQPEYKYWLCQKFNGSFIGAYLNGGQFNVGGKKLPFGLFSPLKENRYEGWLTGAGVSYGYHWMLNSHWNIETSIGVGYEFIRYKQYDCEECAKLKNKGKHHYIGPSKAAISLIYIF